ncbi:MAG: hypothetical protein ACP5HH_05495 [Fervidicoccaceae archaeon]
MKKLFLIFFMAILSTIMFSSPASSQQEKVVIYELLIYSSNSSLDESLIANLTASLSIYPSLHLTLNGTLTDLSNEDILSILEAPDISHFLLSQQQIKELISSGKLKVDNWTLLYMGKGAFQLIDGRFVEGPEVTISFNGGTKNAMYDSSTGFLIWENFYVLTSGNSNYIIFMEALPSPFLTGYSLPSQRFQFLEVAVLVLVILSVYAVATRKKYRIL